MRVFFSNPSYSYRELVKKDIKNVAKEFEAIMLKQILKEAYRSIIRKKGFYQRMYYDFFLEGVSKKLAEAGGIGIAKFIVESYERNVEEENLRDNVRKMVKEAGLPEWVSLIPEIESGYDPKAISKKGAAGLWQLMPNTAKSLGLKVDRDVDERFDPIKSTEAAIRYVKYLLEKFREPELVLIAYNWGEGNLLKLGSLKLSDISDKLPEETRGYLAKFRKLLKEIGWDDRGRYCSEQEDRGGDRALRGEVPEKDIHREGA